MPLREQARLIAAGELSPVALVELYLDRVRRYDPSLHAFITVASESALSQAKRAEEEIAAGEYRGELHGIPVAVKDQIQIDGFRVTGGSRVAADGVGTRDATVIRRLRDAGAIVMGTLNTHEFHVGGTQVFPFGTPRNPWNLERATGGSSSGSASAIAAGLVSATIGCDSGGSNRAPAAACGVVGLKPTWSRVSRDGVFPFAWSTDCVGPLARTVEDSAVVLEAIAGRDSLDPTTSDRPVPRYAELLDDTSLEGLRVGVVEEMYNDEVARPETRAAAKEAIEFLKGQGARISQVSLKLLDEVRFVAPALAYSEAASFHRQNLLAKYEDFDRNTRINLMVGSLLPAGLALLAQRAKVLIAQELLGVFKEVDILVGAGSVGGAPPIGSRPPVTTKAEALGTKYSVDKALGRYTRVFNLAGTPAMTLPAGFDGDGMPLSFHIAGRLFDEATVLRVGHAFQLATDWHGRRPPNF